MNQSMMRRPEVLAPAGSMESLKAAVTAGCDAVYMGGSMFGARAYADNAQGDAMTEAIRYCHLHGKKLYMTVNTLLKEEEIEHSLVEYMAPYYEAGLDAAIVQDVGVLQVLHQYFPKLPLHASTQMSITMGVGDQLLKPYGVDRIVPARELTIEELAQMRQDTDLELEVFVHGALCYCYSGQCLFSSMFGGRSGNRGKCAQPCRLPYTLQEGNDIGPYLLSPKENCNLSHVGDLIQAGVDSFKIEGRMKRPEYTAYVTAMYRKYIDLYMKYGEEEYREYQKKHMQEWQQDLRNLGDIYNRAGFTQGYLEGEAGVPGQKKKSSKGVMLSDMRPKHGGTLVGEVIQVDKHTVTYRACEEIRSHDVVEFRDRNQKPSYEYTLGDTKQAGEYVTARYLKGSKIQSGDQVYRTKAADLLDQIRSLYIDREEKLPLQAVFCASVGQPVTLKISYGEEQVVCVEGDICQEAQRQAASVESIEKIIRQTGETPFEIASCDVKLDGTVFLPVGAMKKLRRQAMEQMQYVMESAGSRKQSDMLEQPLAQTDPAEKQPDKEQYIASIRTWEQLDAACQAEGIQSIYIKMESLSDDKIKEAVHHVSACGKKAYLVLPRIFRQPVYQREEKKLETGDSVYQHPDLSGYVISNLESWHFLTERVGISADRLVLNDNLYTMNRQAYIFWKKQGCQQMTIPLELTYVEQEELDKLSGTQVIVYEHVPLMVSAQCVRYNTRGCQLEDSSCQGEFLHMKDERTRDYIVWNACKYCYNIIYQGEPLVLGQKEQDILTQQGVRSFRYEFTMETGEQTAKILSGQMPSGQTGHFYEGRV